MVVKVIRVYETKKACKKPANLLIFYLFSISYPRQQCLCDRWWRWYVKNVVILAV